VFRGPPLDPDEHWRRITGLDHADELERVPWRLVGLAEPHPQTAVLAEYQFQATWGNDQRSERRLTRVSLGYGRWHDRAGMLVQVTTEPTTETPRSLRASLLDEVVNDPAEASDDLQAEWLAQRRRHASWVSEDDSPALLEIDADDFPGRVCQDRSWWAARCIRDEVVVTVVGRDTNAAELPLVTVSDLRPYLEGRVQYLRELRERGNGL
jgi:hypothetical protein